MCGSFTTIQPFHNLLVQKRKIFTGMQSFRALRNIIFVGLALLLLTIGYVGYIAISNIVADQSRIQQESMAPMFNLVTEEVIKPLHLAMTISKGDFLLSLLDQDELEEDSIVEQLQKLEKEFGLIFFVASENARIQYMSDGRKLDLIEGEVYWYFEALAQEKDILADLGQIGDVHLFYDVKLYNPQDEFIGIVGVGKSLKEFLSRFDEFNQIYGYNFLFLDEADQIILSSDSELATVDENIPNLSDLPWYPMLNQSTLAQGSLNGAIVSDDSEQYLLSEFYIAQLDWRLVLMIPLEARQTQLTNSFVRNLMMVGFIFALLLTLIFATSSYLRSKIERSIGTDALTQVGNRHSIYRRYQKFRNQNIPLCVILIDIDHFKSINDNYGHGTGDKVLKQVAKALSLKIRQQDMLARWGGEEFLLLLPGADASTGARLAEHARAAIEALKITRGERHIKVTASFGIFSGKTQAQLDQSIDYADKALYRAKAKGRNRVEIEPE